MSVKDEIASKAGDELSREVGATPNPNEQAESNKDEAVAGSQPSKDLSAGQTPADLKSVNEDQLSTKSKPLNSVTMKSTQESVKNQEQKHTQSATICSEGGND